MHKHEIRGRHCSKTSNILVATIRNGIRHCNLHQPGRLRLLTDAILAKQTMVSMGSNSPTAISMFLCPVVKTIGNPGKEITGKEIPVNKWEIRIRANAIIMAHIKTNLLGPAVKVDLAGRWASVHLSIRALDIPEPLMALDFQVLSACRTQGVWVFPCSNEEKKNLNFLSGNLIELRDSLLRPPTQVSN